MVGVKETVRIGTLWTLRKKDSLPAAARSGGRRSQSQALLASATLVAAMYMAYHHESRRVGMVKIGMTMLKTSMTICVANAEKNVLRKMTNGGRDYDNYHKHEGLYEDDG